MKTCEWDMIIGSMKNDLVRFVNSELSAENLYKKAVVLGVGPACRKLVKHGASRARRMSREALRRRSVVVTKVPDTLTV